MYATLNIATVPTERDIDNANLSLRLKGSEAVRYWKVLDTAKQRNPYAAISDVIRELIGLDEPTLITKEELEFFRVGSRKTEALDKEGIRLSPKSEEKMEFRGRRKKNKRIA